MALVSEAVLSALDYFIRQGGGKDPHALCRTGRTGTGYPSGNARRLPFPGRKGRAQAGKILLRYDPEKGMTVYTRPLRGEMQTVHFEKNWALISPEKFTPA